MAGILARQSLIDLQFPPERNNRSIVLAAAVFKLPGLNAMGRRRLDPHG
jgi:hypothetical protein